MIEEVVSVLIADTELLALVNGTNIFPVRRRQRSGTSAVVVDVVDVRPTPTKDRASELDFVTMRLNCYAKSPALADDIMKATREAMDNYHAVLNGQRVEIRFEGYQTAYDDAEDELYINSMEYMVMVNRDDYTPTNAGGAPEPTPSGFLIDSPVDGSWLDLATSHTELNLINVQGGQEYWRYEYADGSRQVRVIPTAYNAEGDIFYTDYTAPTSVSGTQVERLDMAEDITWGDLIAWVDTPPALYQNLSSGDVWRYQYDSGLNLYRFIPSTGSTDPDAFYTNFDGTNLEGFLVAFA